MHPDLFALLESVRANPADHLRRLVLADWLDEHGLTDADRGRADLIRVQLELHRRPVADPNRPALLEREKSLIAEHAAAWGDGLPRRLIRPHADDHGFSVELGMIRPWFGRGRRWVADAASDNPVWAWVDGVTLVDVSEEELAEVTASPALRRLNSLSVVPDGWLEWTGDLPPGAAGARLIAESEHAAGLTHLNLPDCVIDTKGAEAIAGSPHLQALVQLHLGGYDCTPANLIGDDGVRALAASPHLTRLEHLNLSECVITSVGAAALAASPNSRHLTHLNLTGNPLGATGLRALAESPFLTRLTFLSGDAIAFGRLVRPDRELGDIVEARTLLRQRFGNVWREESIR